MKKGKNKNLEYYMSLNYILTVEQYEEDGELRFGLQIPELPGVWADGTTMEEAYLDLIETKRLWFETCLDKGIDIPEPISESDFSGKFILRLSPKIHMTLSKMAKRSKVSLNQYIRTLLEEQISISDLISEISQSRQLIGEQSKGINKLGKVLGSLEQRIKSLEEAFSSMSYPGFTGVFVANTAQAFSNYTNAVAWRLEEAEETGLQISVKAK